MACQGSKSGSATRATLVSGCDSIGRPVVTGTGAGYSA